MSRPLSRTYATALRRRSGATPAVEDDRDQSAKVVVYIRPVRHTTINLAIRPKRRSSKRSRLRARTAAIGLAALTIAGLAPALSTPTPAAAATLKANDTEPNPVGFTTHQGRWLVDSTGRVEVPHGMNMVEKSAPYYPGPQADGFGADDAAYLASQGYTYVRLGIEMNALSPPPATSTTPT